MLKKSITAAGEILRPFSSLFIEFKKISRDKDVRLIFNMCIGGVLLAVILLLAMSESEEALSFAELLLVFLYAVIVRSVRPSLITRWNYFAEKLSAPYVIGFMVLLMSCPFLMIVNLEPVAEQVANVAYFMLVFAVIIELKQYIRERKNIEEE